MKITNYFLIIFIYTLTLSCSTDDENMDIIQTPILSSDLQLVLSANNYYPEIETNIDFTIRISNNSTQIAENISVEILLQDGYNYIEDNANSTYNQSTGIWSITSINSNSSKELIITVKINSSGDYTNMVQIIASNNEDPDSTPNNGDLSEDDQDSIVINPLAPTDVNVTTLAILNAADALALDAQACILYASSYGDNQVYTINFDGDITTLLTNQPGAAGIDFDTEGNLYLARYNVDDVIKRDPLTGVIENFASVSNPIALEFDSNQNLYANNNVNNSITKIDQNGTTSLIGINVINNSSLAIDNEDNIYISDYSSGVIIKIDAITSQQTVFSTIPIITGGIGFIIYSNDYFYVTAIAEGTVYQIDNVGNAERIAGIPGVSGTIDGDGNTATFNRPIGIVASEDGKTLYVGQNGGDGAIRVITGFNE